MPEAVGRPGDRALRELRDAPPCPRRGRRDGGGRVALGEILHLLLPRRGGFIEPELTREQAIEQYAPMMAANLGMPLEKAKEMVGQYLSTLPRWRGG